MTEQERKESKRKRDKKYRAAHPEKVKEYQARYYAASRDKSRDKKMEYSKKYCASHPEEIRVYRKRYYAENSEKMREVGRRSNTKARHKALCMIARSDKPCCVRCGCDDERFLEINHKNGGGNKERKETMQTGGLKFSIINGNRSVEDLEILCKPCNAIHALELKYGSVPLTTTFHTEAIE